MNETKGYDNLIDEEVESSTEICWKLKTLINASWDSNTVKLELEKLINSYGIILTELSKYE